MSAALTPAYETEIDQKKEKELRESGLNFENKIIEEVEEIEED